MLRTLLALAVTAALTLPAQADTLTQWNFNSVVADGNTATGTTTPAVGTGAATALGVTASFASGDANGGSSDPATGDDSGWGLTGFAAQGTGDKTRGVQFSASTVGFENIVFSFDIRHSNTSSQWEQVQYSIDGSSFIDIASFSASAGDTWFNGRSVDLSNVAGVANNANFAVRVVAAFAPGGSVYTASTTGSNYATTGTWRFDMATVSGTAIAAVPEPGTWAMLLGGVAAVGFLARRRG